MRYEYLAIREQLEADVRDAWDLPAGAKVYKREAQIEPDTLPYVVIRRKANMTRVAGTATSDHYTVVFEVIGVFRDNGTDDVDFEQVSLAALLRNKVYETGASPNNYGGYGFLLFVPEMLVDVDTPGEGTYAVSVTVAMQLAHTRAVTGYATAIEPIPN